MSTKEMNNLKVGDYVNGFRVEMIENGITEFGVDEKDLYYKTLLDVKEHCNNAKYILEIINKALDDNE